MPGGIFDLTQYLTDGRVEWPQGDLNDIDPNSVPTWVEAWVVQGGGEVAGQYLIGPNEAQATAQVGLVGATHHINAGKQTFRDGQAELLRVDSRRWGSPFCPSTMPTKLTHTNGGQR